MMGVSAAIMDNVIFCHQVLIVEYALWDDIISRPFMHFLYFPLMWNFKWPWLHQIVLIYLWNVSHLFDCYIIIFAIYTAQHLKCWILLLYICTVHLVLFVIIHTSLFNTLIIIIDTLVYCSLDFIVSKSHLLTHFF